MSASNGDAVQVAVGPGSTARSIGVRDLLAALLVLVVALGIRIDYLNEISAPRAIIGDAAQYMNYLRNLEQSGVFSKAIEGETLRSDSHQTST